jgi:transcriptional regulator with XRE-family HTH domain
VSNDAPSRGGVLHDPGELKRRRILAGLSQSAFADKIGIDQTYISKLESGGRYPTPEMLARLAKGLRCKPADLLASEKNDGKGGAS